MYVMQIYMRERYEISDMYICVYTQCIYYHMPYVCHMIKCQIQMIVNRQ